MKYSKFLILAIIPLIFSIGIAPSLPFSNADYLDNINREDTDTQCREGLVLVYRTTSNQYVCTDDGTAGRWIQLGIAELVRPLSMQQPVEEKMEEQMMEEVMEEPSLGIEIPPYPDKPSIHPKLLASNEFWMPVGVHKVTDRVYSAVGFALANTIMIEGDDGLIIVDTQNTYESAKKVISEFRTITDKPVVAIIYTHGHLDHVHGTGAFLEEGEDIEIYAHESHVDFYINENSVLGPIASIRTAHAAGALLPSEGPDRPNTGSLGPATSGTIAYAPPTQTFSDELEIEISGVKLQMVFVAGESSDQIYVWLPDDEVLLIGDNIYGIIPNIYTLRGAVYRDPMNYVNALDKMIPLEAEHLVSSHLEPISGKEAVKDILISTRDATQYIYDQTIRGMNAGYTADELSRMIQLPEHLDNHQYLSKSRNDVSSHVKLIYYGNLGWFEGNSAFLNEVSLEERSHKIVEGFGGVESSITSMRNAIDNEEYEWAAELGTYIINVEPDNTEAKLLTAYTLRVLSFDSEGMDERNWLLTDALKLEGKITIVPGAFTQTSPEQMAELPIEKLITFLPTKLDPQKAAGIDKVLGLSYSDIGQEFTLHVRNSILAVNEGMPDNPDMKLVLDSNTHKLIVGGHLGIVDAIESGQAELTGEMNELVDFIELFDILTFNDHGVG